MDQNNTHLLVLFHSFCVSRYQEWLKWVFCLRFTRLQFRYLHGLDPHRRLNWGEICFQTPSDYVWNPMPSTCTESCFFPKPTTERNSSNNSTTISCSNAHTCVCVCIPVHAVGYNHRFHSHSRGSDEQKHKYQEAGIIGSTWNGDNHNINLIVFEILLGMIWFFLSISL